MNTHLFDQSSLSCPICSQSQLRKDRLLCSGLVLCKSCHERIVVSWSGNYVRDPFTVSNLETQVMLRRQSHPLLRVLRDTPDVSESQKGTWLKWTGGVIVVALLWTGLFRLATMSGTSRSTQPSSPAPGLVSPTPSSASSLPSQ